MVGITRWAEELVQKYKAGISNSFVIYGNIGDYVIDNTLVIDYIVELLNGLKIEEIATYDNSQKLQYVKKVFSREEETRTEWSDMCKEIEKDYPRKAFIIRYPEMILPSEERYMSENDRNRAIDLHKALNSVGFLNSANIVIFLTESSQNLNKMFLNSNSKTSAINITLPIYEERLNFINNSLALVEVEDELDQRHNQRIKSLKKEITLEEFANLTAGLTLTCIEDIILMALIQGSLSRNMILDRKKELIQKEFGEIIEIMDTEGYSLSKFAGQDGIKQYFKEVVIDAVRDQDLEIVPKGILLMGPPGTGKTYFSRCLAGDAGMNCVEFKMSKILDKYVGEAEKNLEKALSVFRALSPVLVFIDEADQALQRGDNDTNSVNRNLFGMFLAEMSKPENRGKIIWVGATNYPNKMDEALKRAGRFDKKIPFFAPTDEERRAVFEIHLKKASMPFSKDVNIEVLVNGTKGYTQAEIENIVVKALELTKRAKLSEITQEKLELALDYMLSAQNERITEMEDIALKECNDQEFIPKHYKERHRKLFSTN